MRPEPRVDAMGVESVLTIREHAALVAVGELRQANGAVLERAVGGGGESKSGKGLDDGRVEARVVERGGGGGIGRKRMREAAATAAEADVGVEENNDYYENEEENGGAHHDLAVVGILGFNVWFRSHDGERVKRE